MAKYQESISFGSLWRFEHWLVKYDLFAKSTKESFGNREGLIIRASGEVVGEYTCNLYPSYILTVVLSKSVA